MKYNLNNKKLGEPRLYWHRYNSKTKTAPYVIIKCSCCNEKVEIFYDDLRQDKYTGLGWKSRILEINGVLAPNEFWIQLLQRLKVIPPQH